MKVSAYLPGFFQHLIWLPVRLFLTSFCSLEIKGLNNIEEIEGGTIIAANHATEMDPLYIVSTLSFFSDKLPVIYVVDEKRIYKHNYTGLKRLFYGSSFLEYIGGLPARKGLNDYEEALGAHIDILRAGKVVGVFPIGKRHSVEEIKDAKAGVAFLALHTGAPVVPLKIDGLSRDLKLSDYILRRQKVTVTYGTPVDVEALASKLTIDREKYVKKELESLSREIMSIVSSL